MAFKQSPGRGNYAKTGHGLPSPLRQEEPKTAKMKAQVAKKEAVGPTYKEQTAAEKFASKAPGTGLMGGTETDIQSGMTKAKEYEKKLVTQPSGDTFITTGGGKTIASAKFNPHGNKEVEALKKKYESEKSSTKDARKANVVAQNYRLKLAGNK
jgi:hypothetical protein